MRKPVVPIVVLIALVANAAPAFAQPYIDVKIVAPTSTTWQLWAMDDSNTADMGIAYLQCTITPSAGTISCAATTGFVAPQDTADDANGDILGFEVPATAVFGNNKASILPAASQGTRAGALTQDTDSVVFGVGQTASARNNNGNFIGYTDLAGDVVRTDTNPHAASNNIAGWVEFFAGTNNVANSVSNNSITGIGGDLFDNVQPSNGGTYSTMANVDANAPWPEPASLVLLAFGGVTALSRRRRQSSQPGLRGL